MSAKRVTPEAIREAAELLRGQVIATPCVRSRTLSEILGAEIYLKLENLQYTASFKDRGSLVKLLSLDAPHREAGVIAVSAGNHAQGVAYHAQRLGIPAVIVMPKETPFNKVQNTERLGAEVVLQGAGLSEAEEHAVERAGRDGLTLVHPYDDPAIIAGQGTIALEMLREVPDLEVSHQRWFYDVPVKLTGIDFLVETRDYGHLRIILDALAERAIPARLLSPAAHQASGAGDDA